MKKLLALFLLGSLLGCGGGGSGPNTPSSPAALVSVDVSKKYSTSYEYSKYYSLENINIPYDIRGYYKDGPLAWALGDFFNNGKLTLFTAVQNYGIQTGLTTVTNDTSYHSDFVFWNVNSDGSLTKVKSIKGCIHPRKGVVADFNNDGTNDILVSCHGYDDFPFGGETSKLLVSNGKGDINIIDATEIGFYHALAAGDINNDGYPDIAVTNYKNPNKVYFLINQKDNTFVADYTRLQQPITTQYWTVELVDINKDGINDLIIGGHESESPTKILFGSNDGVFGRQEYIVPTMSSRQIVLDFVFLNDILYVNRTGGYQETALQAVNIKTNQVKIMRDDVVGPTNWIAWYQVRNNKVCAFLSNTLCYSF